MLVLTDDQRFDSLKYMPQVQSFFGNGGTDFGNAFVTTPLCCPSRSSILTGLYAHATGVLNPATIPAFDDSQTLGVWLQQAGYRTGYIGKLFNVDDGTAAVPPGWDDWQVFRASSLYPRPGGYYNYWLNANGRYQWYGHSAATYSTTVLGAMGDQFIRDAGTDPRPFFLVWAPRAPHGPATPEPKYRHAPVALGPRPPSFNEADVSDKHPLIRATPKTNPATADFRAREQVRTLMSVDDQFAGLVGAVKAAGQLDNTVFIYTSDNGLMNGEHRLSSVKGWPFEESIRVPLLVREGWQDGPATVSQFALNIDLAPTVLDYAGATAPMPMDGASLRPLVEGQDPAWRSDFLVEAWGPFKDRLPTYAGVRGADYLFTQYSNGFREYYDLTADPFELTNRASDPAYAGDVAEAQERLFALEGE